MGILDEIVGKRRSDVERLGVSLGHDVPAERTRGPVVPFVGKKCAILEVKRASPSKGDIAPNLDAAATAAAYAKAGAGAISVLTEEHWFKGSLDDLSRVCEAVDAYAARSGTERVAVLRKDFLLFPEEVDVAYRLGADAVLLIARILDADVMAQMVRRCEALGMTAFVELRLAEDLEKLSRVCGEAGKDRIVCGVNARDLFDFSIDLLTPCRMLSKIRAVLGADARVVFESGIRTPEAASFAGSLGFTGMLLGEAAARNPGGAELLVKGFVDGSMGASSRAWLSHAELLEKRAAEGAERSRCAHGGGHGGIRPLVKICGLTSVTDALYATLGGAEFLGFIFCAASPRNVDPAVVQSVRSVLDEQFPDGCLDEHVFSAGCDDVAPKLVGVVTDLSSAEGRMALSLVKDGTLDFIQLHGKLAVSQFFSDGTLSGVPHFCVVNVSEERDLDDFDALRQRGEPRILVDAGTGDRLGGTGSRIPGELLLPLRKKTKLWIAGGITPGNAAEVALTLSPELLDVSSGVESAPGVKDREKLLALFSALDGA